MAVNSQMIDIAGADGAFQGYFAVSDRSRAGVVLIQEIFGVNSHIRDVSDRLAAAGYAVLAPDLFWRVQPDVQLGYTPDDIAKGRTFKDQVAVDDAMEDLRASFATLRARPECQGHKTGVVGFCWGGLLTYLAAARLDPACASSYYGGGIANFLGEADKIGCPIQFHFGDQDQAIPMDQVENIRAAVQGKSAEVFIYHGAGHGFHCDQRGSYNVDSAKLAWERTLGLFDRFLG